MRAFSTMSVLIGFDICRIKGGSLESSSKQQGGTIPLPVDLFVVKELQFIGSFGMRAARYPAMPRMVESGKLHPGKLVTGMVAIEDAGCALAGIGKFSTIGMTVITKW